MIEALLATYIEKEEHQVRHVAVQYAGEVFPPSHTPSKFVLLLGAGDSKDEVANEAKLHLYGPINKAHDQKSSRMQAVKSEDESMQQQLLLLPDFCEMTSVIIDKVPFIYYVSTSIAQNLIWLPNFSQQENFFFNITFWQNFHAVVWNLYTNKKKIRENVVVDKKVLT